ncbi:histone-lysine N-methyltransferase 2B-like isoform X1 [Carassius carassius]|uniref:histone-lysine N-methyltransferase 2B-like isoform X1 n=1 Tax=Carassius carassius TaxID=217509 RepID=UPI002868F7A8|nr:histone-lysine N-methyltransferase 2B-like isoform X1 [Carassius carassius]
MTDELNRASAEPETMQPEETVPVGADVVTVIEYNAVENSEPAKVTVELLPEWLMPMEEEEDGGEGVKSSEWITRKTNNDVPKVKRRRGRPPIARNARHGLTRLDFKKGLHADRPKKTVRNLLERTRSSLTSATAIPIPDPIRTPEVLPQTPQSIIPISPIEDSSFSKIPGTEFHSPSHLMRVSPLSIDQSATRNFIHSPAVKVGNVTQQIVSSIGPGKDGTEPPLRLWLCPSLEPISPTKSQDTFSEQTVSLPEFPETMHNGTVTLKESLPFLSKCEICGGPFSAQKIGDTLCYRCYRTKPEKKHSPPNIVFRKVGQDQWEVGKTKHPRKQMLKQYHKLKKIVKTDFVPDGDEDEDDWAAKKRNRRMCRQCVACLREDDCGKCDFCMDKPKFGGSNKKRQKCRLRQCKFQSKLHGHRANGMLNPSLPQRRKNVKPKLKKRGRPRKRKFKSDPWEDDDEVSDKDDDEEEEDLRHYKMNGRKGGRRKWNYTFKEDEEDVFVETVIDDDEPSITEEDPDILGSERSVMVSNELYSNTSGLSAQGLYYNVSGVLAAPHMLGSVPLCNNNPLAMGEVISSLPMGDDVTQNGFLQIEMVRVGSPPSHYAEEAQSTEQHVSESQLEPTPVITQIFSLAGGENDRDRDQGLMELFTSLGQTVMPAHWVGVMSKGPVLQLLQCSKLSTMADTVVQIEKGFFYQVSVQNQPLLLMHAVYSRHPTCLESVDDVVSLLLDLEGLGVCQGYQNFHMGPPWEPRMSVRAALCDLLIPKDEEQCPKCTQPVES